MHIAFILDPLDDIKVYKDSSYAMLREASKRGHMLSIIHQENLAWKDKQVSALARRLTLTEKKDWYELDDAQLTPLQEFDVVLMRKDPPFNLEYIYSTYLLELAEAQGATIYNRPSAIRDFNEKLAIAKFPQFTAPSIVTSDASLLHEFLEQHKDIILKPLDGMGGSSVFRVHEFDHNINVIIETLTGYGRRTIMAQRYIPEISKGDKRVLLIGGKVVPFALARIPKPGETRGNLAAGGTGVAQELSERDREIAETLAPVLYEQGLMLVGLDIIGEYLTEINVTSPTCMQEIHQQTGFNPAAMMIDILEKRC